MNQNTILIIICVIGILFISLILFRSIRMNLSLSEGQRVWESQRKKIVINFIFSFFSNFFDSFGLGGGGFLCPAYKLSKSVEDRLIPGTLLAGGAVPALLRAILCVRSSDDVAINTMILSAVALVIGGYIGSKFMSIRETKAIRIALGIGMLLTAGVTLCQAFDIGPFSGAVSSSDLSGSALAIGLVSMFVIGLLSNTGLSIFPPIMALSLMLGMNAGTGFSIMVFSSAVMMGFAAGPVYIRENRYDMAASIAQFIAGCISVVIAMFLVDRTADSQYASFIIAAFSLIGAIAFIITSGRKDD